MRQVIGRVYTVDGETRCELNTIGRQLSDHTAVYAEDNNCEKRDALAKEFVMELLRKARPMSMDLVTCTKMTAAAYRLADCMMLASTIMPTEEPVAPVVEGKKLRFITQNPRTVYNDGLWVNVNLDIEGKFSRPSFVEPEDPVKVVYATDDTEHISKANDPRINWANVKSFRKLG